jgi:putative ATP-binding cassette transporter
MNEREKPIERLFRSRLLPAVRRFAASEVGWKAKMLFAGLIVLLLGINGLNVVNSYVGRDFMTAIAERNTREFTWQAVLYIGVFAASTIVAVISRFSEESLGLLWREWLTGRLVKLYLGHHTYYRIKERGQLDNPDQRIAEDVRACTVTAISFVLLVLNGSITILAFSGVLWSISPLLFTIAVLYAAGGSYGAIVLGRPLLKLNYDQLDKEANFRAELIHVRENAESVALLHREGRLEARLLNRLDALVANFRDIIAVNRNLGFFTTGYNWLIQIIPALVVAPMFISGKVEFGVIPQATMAFAHLLGAFSLIVNQFQSISSFAAVITRLDGLAEAIEQAQSAETAATERCEHHRPMIECPICAERLKLASALELCEESEDIAYEHVTLRSPEDGRTLVKDLSVSIPQGRRLLIVGPNDAAKVALLRATAGIWGTGAGRIARPEDRQLYFLPERPYLPPGTLRDLLVRTGQEPLISDDRIREVLAELKLESLLARIGGLEAELDWDDALSLGEQQLLAIARLLLAKPRFAFLDRISTALNPEDVAHILDLLSKQSITYLTLGRSRHGKRDTDDKLEDYDAALELAEDGTWVWRWIGAGQIVE